MNVRFNQVALGFVAVAAISGSAIAVNQTASTGNPAFDAGTRAGSTAPLAPPASPAPLLPFGMNPGDCPTEDSCEFVQADYRHGKWTVEISPVVR